MKRFLLLQFQALELLFLSFNFVVALSYPLNSTPPLCHPTQSLALLQFKSTFNLDCSTFVTNSASIIDPEKFNPRTESWKASVDCCLWSGVTCDKLTGQVTGLDLGFSCLIGPIRHNSTLFQLSHLQGLSLAYNDHGGSPISLGFGQFASLEHLNLSSSGFSGDISPGMSHLSKLVSLDLSQNDGLVFGRQGFRMLVQNLTRLSDLILDSVDMSSVSVSSFRNLSSSLKSMSLSGCALVGIWPEEVFHLPSLEKLVLEGNYGLNGSVPSMSNRSSPVRILDLSFSGFSGDIPTSIRNLNYLDLSNNNYIGPIPSSLGNLSGITYLHLGNNLLTGPIPSSLANLELLTDLSLFGNNLTGSVPDFFHNLTRLSRLDLSSNFLTGQIPPSIFDLEQLGELTLRDNQLSGPLPNQINGKSILEQLNLANNLFNGTIPHFVFSLDLSLRFLDLSHNQLGGRIPEFKSTTLNFIDLSNNKLQGPIPSSVFDLEATWYLDFSSNNFNGTLDLDMFSKLKLLKTLGLGNNNLSLEVNGQGNFTWPMLKSLDLSSCNIKSFPYFLSTQSDLRYLSLSQNRISGETPEWLWQMLLNSSLYYLDISLNQLTSIKILSVPSNLAYILASGNLLSGEIPSLICNITDLTILDLSNNSLSGIIPQCLVRMSSLSALNLRMNNFSSSIPQHFPMDSILRSLDLSGNQLEGKLPQSLAKCKELKILDFGDNKILDRFPSWMDSLPNLQVLVLRFNRLYGRIGRPKSTRPFPELRILDISNNNLTGLLPHKYFGKLKAMAHVEDTHEMKSGELYMGEKYYDYKTLLTIKGWQVDVARILIIFSTMDLSRNKFKGGIPEEIGKLKSLKGLNFSDNSLSGSIPSSLANMSMLESLDLSFNNLSGEIPEELTDLNFLTVLNLSYNNQLEGPIPQGKQFNTFDNDSYRMDPYLCGLPLMKTCGGNGGDGTPSFESTPTTENDSSWDWIWKAVGMGYGSGIVIGFSIAYMVFMAGEPLWFASIVDRLILPFYIRATRQNQRRATRHNQKRKEGRRRS